MKKLFVILISILFFSGCMNLGTDQLKLDQLEKNVRTVEEQIEMLMTQNAGASFYPARGLTGGEAGDLDKISSVAEDDVAMVVLEADATYGDVVFIYVADSSGDGESVPYIIDPDEAGDIRWKLTNVYEVETVHFTILQPDDADEGDYIPVWCNYDGNTFHITAIYAMCDDQAGDDGNFTLYEVSFTNVSSETQINDGAITMSTDGTDVDTYTDTSINATYDDIENGNCITYEPSADDLQWVKVVLKGYYIGAR